MMNKTYALAKATDLKAIYAEGQLLIQASITVNSTCYYPEIQLSALDVEPLQFLTIAYRNDNQICTQSLQTTTVCRVFQVGPYRDIVTIQHLDALGKPTTTEIDVILAEFIPACPVENTVEKANLSGPGIPPCAPISVISLEEMIKLHSMPNDPYTINKVSISRSAIHLNVTYGGGCKAHDFEMYWDGLTMESYPPQYVFYLKHNANNDTCKARVTQDLCFNLPKEVEQPSCIHVGDGYISVKTCTEIAKPTEKNFTDAPNFFGTSETGNLQEAIEQAIEAAKAHYSNTLGTDVLVGWELVNVSGNSGGIAGQHSLMASIAAWPPK